MNEYAKIHPMNAKLPQPLHESYRQHRRQLFWQILLPMALTILLCLALVIFINIAAFRDGGDTVRWAAVSIIWVLTPLMIGLLILLALLAGLVYLMKKLLDLTPTYTGQAQDAIHKAAGFVRRVTDALVKPIFFVEGLGAGIRAFFGRK
jgi:hypothetical protein